MILQIPAEVTKTFTEEWGVPGAVILILVIALGFLVKYIRSQNKAEKDRILKDKDDIFQKNEILYTEIKNMQNEQIVKYAEMKVKDNEIQKEMVLALKNNTDAFNNHTLIFNKLINKL